jgi:ribose-phosphate pyrophosphokinase
MVEIYIQDITRAREEEFVPVKAHKTWFFPAGECGVKLDIPSYLVGYQGPVTLVARLNNSNDFFELANVKNALEEYFMSFGIKNPIDLVLPYIPYAQQDRVCTKGEAFSAKVFANLLNSLNFNRVVVADPHSGISSALINNVIVVSRFELIDQHQELRTNLGAGTLIAVDSGANKATFDLAKYFGHSEFIRADKLRNLATGEILESVIYTDKVPQRVIMVDDLSINGGTFIKLAKVLRDRGAKTVALYVTHLIAPNGVKNLYQGGIDEVYCTNSYRNTYPTDLKENEKFTMVNIIPYLLGKLS